MSRTHLACLALGASIASASTAATPSNYEQMVARVKARQAAEMVLASAQTASNIPVPVPAAPAANAVPSRLIFSNGDRVSGTLQSLRSGAIKFSAFQSKSIDAKFSALVDLQTAKAYEVTLADGSVVLATFWPTNQAATFGLKTVTGSQEVPRATITGIETQDYAKARRAEAADKGKVTLDKVWKGHLDAKYSESSGNTEVRNVVVAAEATRTTAVDKLQIGLLTNNASAGSTKTAQRSWGNVRMDLFLPKNLFYFVQGRLETDELEQVDQRTTLGLGIGKRWTGAHNLSASFGLGYSFVREAFTNGSDNSEGTLLVTADLDRDLTDTLSIEHRMIAYPKISDGEFRFQTTTNFKSALGNNLSFLVGFFNKYDSDPIAGIKKNDFTITTGLRRDF